MIKREEIDEAPGLSAPIGCRKFYFVRHGKTEWNNQLRYQGITDIPLNDEGREQARKAALRFSEVKLDAIICSPLVRARETAEIIAAYHDNIAVECFDLRIEINFGIWEGLSVKDIKRISGDAVFAKWKDNPLHVDAPKGENMSGFFERSEKFAEYLIERSGENILTVGHGGMLRGLFVPMLEYPRTSIFWKTRIDNCSITTFTLEPGNQFVLACLNDTIHMKVAEESIKSIPII